MDDCSMSGPLSVTSSQIYMIEMENDTALPTKRAFHRRFVDDIYNNRKKTQRVNYVIHLIIIIKTLN